MKVFTLFILLTLSGVLQAHNLLGQDLNKIMVSLKVENKSLRETLKAIEKTTNLRFSYKSEDISGIDHISYSGRESVKEVLNEVLKGKGLIYETTDGVIIIKSSRHNKGLSDPSATNENAEINDAKNESGEQQADVVVRGRVTDETDQPLPGVSIALKDAHKKIGVTDSKGEFRVTVPERSVLIFSYVSFASQEVIADNAMLNVRMEPSFGALKEVVVVGYGKQSKATITGSISTVTGADLNRVPSPNITQSLAGRLPGLTAFSASSLPGQDDSRLLIRGLSTSGDNTPLIVIDGIPRSNFMSPNSSSTLTNINPLSYLDPNDIESVSILKDAAATAVYGARAANGVILVTTKRGTEGAPTITYSGNVGMQTTAFLSKPLDSYSTALLWNQAWKNEGVFAPTAGGAKGYSDEALAAIQNGSDPDRYSNTNWYKAIFDNAAVQTEHNLSISGGTQKTKYFISGGFFDQDGFFSGVGFKRYNIRANLDGKISKNVDFSLSLSGRDEAGKNNVGGTASALFISPLEPIRYQNGTYHYNSLFTGSPYLNSKGIGGYNNTTKDYYEGIGSLTYHIPSVEGLSVKGLLSFDKYFIFSKNFTTPVKAYILNDDNTFTLPANLANAKPSLIENYNQYQSLTEEASVNYDRTFGNHQVNGLLLYTQTQNSGDNLSATRINFPSSILDQLDEGSLTGLTNSGSGLKNARKGVVGRAGYNYKAKYLAEFDFRYDGSDLFPPGHRYGFFPAVSAGWRLSEEPFIKDNLKFITNLKLRGSWGQAGNDRAGAFQYLNSYVISSDRQNGSYGFGGTAGAPVQILAPGTISSNVFTWERATTVDIGLEANLWKDLLGIEVDVFKKRTSDILIDLSSQVPAIVGAAAGTLPLTNYGIVDNKGIEIQLSHQGTVGKVNYFVRPNFTFNQSKVISYPEPANIIPALRKEGRPVALAGDPFGTGVQGYLSDGLYQSQADIDAGPTPLFPNVKPGDIKYKDNNDDGKISSSDLVYISKGRTPGIIYGLSAGASLKGFDVNIFFQGAGDATIYLPNQLTNSFINSNRVAYSLQTNYWTPENPSANYPRLTVTSLNNQQSSDYWIRNGAYLRLKNVEIGYTLPGDWLKKIGLQSTRIFINGNNLFTLSHVNGLIDPESSYNTYPMIKVYNLGLTVKF